METELQVSGDGRYLDGAVPFGYALWGDRLAEVPRELDACVTMIWMTREGRSYEEIAATAEKMHGVKPTHAQYDEFILSVRRRYGPL
jgi:hypothetical protein